MDDVLRRLDVVESQLAKTREDVSAIKAAVEHLATKADLGGRRQLDLPVLSLGRICPEEADDN
jgi:hypothetical protein